MRVSTEMSEAIARFRGWCATTLAATFGFETLSIKEIRGILQQSFGASAFAENTQVIQGWRPRGDGGIQIRQAYSRVGMLEARGGSTKETPGKKRARWTICGAEQDTLAVYSESRSTLNPAKLGGFLARKRAYFRHSWTDIRLS